MTNRPPTANACQRARRAKHPRIDYYPSPETLAAIHAKRERWYPLNTNSRILNAIIAEWVTLKAPAEKGAEPINLAPGISTHYAHANESGTNCDISAVVHAHANDFGTMPAWMRPPVVPQRIICGARTQSGRPCHGKSVPGKKRCKWHGGCSTGPKTVEGKARALANLRQYRTLP